MDIKAGLPGLKMAVVRDMKFGHASVPWPQPPRTQVISSVKPPVWIGRSDGESSDDSSALFGPLVGGEA